jgi:hypothetical protein
MRNASATRLDVVDAVASTSVGDDCGKGFAPPSRWARAFARLEQRGFGIGARP